MLSLSLVLSDKLRWSICWFVPLREIPAFLYFLAFTAFIAFIVLDSTLRCELPHGLFQIKSVSLGRVSEFSVLCLL